MFMVIEILSDIEIRSFIETQNNAENQSNNQENEQNNQPPAIND